MTAHGKNYKQDLDVLARIQHYNSIHNKYYHKPYNNYCTRMIMHLSIIPPPPTTLPLCYTGVIDRSFPRG